MLAALHGLPRTWVALMITENPRFSVGDAAYWLAQATADYQRLSSTLSVLASELATLQAVINGGPLESAPAFVTLPLNSAPSLPQVAAIGSKSDEANVRVNLLGPFQLYIGDRKLSADVPAQVKTALKYLISHRKHMTRKDALIDLFWPDANPSVLSGRLRALMHMLRKSVPCSNIGLREFIVTVDSDFVIHPEARLWVDVEEFEQHWHNGWRLARAGYTGEALLEYERAEALYVGDYLEDEIYADWTLLRREGLRDAHATILTMLANMSLKEMDYAGAIIWAQKLIEQDNCREDAYRILILSHKQLGQHSRASYWYGLCMRTLKTELGVEPSRETQMLLQNEPIR